MRNHDSNRGAKIRYLHLAQRSLLKKVTRPPDSPIDNALLRHKSILILLLILTSSLAFSINKLPWQLILALSSVCIGGVLLIWVIYTLKHPLIIGVASIVFSLCLLGAAQGMLGFRRGAYSASGKMGMKIDTITRDIDTGTLIKPFMNDSNFKHRLDSFIRHDIDSLLVRRTN